MIFKSWWHCHVSLLLLIFAIFLNIFWTCYFRTFFIDFLRNIRSIILDVTCITLFQFDILTSSIPLEPWICVQSVWCCPPLSEYTGISWECQYFNETIVNSPLAANDGPSPTFCGPPILTTALFSTSVGTMQQNLFSLALLRPQINRWQFRPSY